MTDPIHYLPFADGLTLLTLDNGSRSTLPTATLDLSTGFVSGGFVRSALHIDVRNLRDRLSRRLAGDNSERDSHG